MRRLAVCLCLLLFIVNFPAHAQDDSAYRLHTPTAEDYIAALPGILEPLSGASYEQETVETELALRFPELAQQNYERIEALYQLFRAQNSSIDESFWLGVRVISWLTTNKIRLELSNEIQFQDEKIPVIAADLNGDGQDEWILDFQQYTLQGLIVVRRDENGLYQNAPTPLPFTTLDYGMFNLDDNHKQPLAQFKILHIGDINADRIPELIVLYTEEDEGRYSVGGRYSILTWRDNALVNIGDESLSFYLQNLDTTWELVNIDINAVDEIKQVREMRDNWDCFWTQETTFTWDGSSYSPGAVNNIFPDDGNCTMREAEAAMWEHDYHAAITQYEKINPTIGYAAFRLAIAYILDGQIDKGIRLLEDSKAQSDVYGSLPELTNALLSAYDEMPSAANLCIVAYSFFKEKPFYIYFAQSLEVGHTVDNIVYGEGMYSAPPALPTTSGCDAPVLIQDILDHQDFITSKSPSEQLEALGLKVHSVFTSDLNGDGKDEWVVWLSDVHLGAVLFVSNGTSYQVSRVALTGGYSADDLSWLLTVQLPGDAGKALLNIDYRDYSDPMPLGMGMGGGPGICAEPGYMSLWQLTDGKLVSPLHALLCEQVEPKRVVNDLQSVSEVYAWDWNDNLEDYVPVTYVWDDAGKIFHYPLSIQATLTPIYTSQPQQEYKSYSAASLYAGHQYERVIAYQNQAIADLPGLDNQLLYWRYLAALSFEALNRPDDALTEYVAIYNAAPDSAWGKLATLHLEKVTS